ncbi:MAG TPA: hypothetical protein VGE07_27940 [Herpetosiphonaceae bacterium]
MNESQGAYRVPGIAARREAGLGFLARWCLAALPLAFVPALVGLALGQLADSQAHWAITDWLDSHRRGFATSLHVMALALQGLAQWLVLRAYLPRFQHWILIAILAGLTQILVYELVGLRGPGWLIGMVAHGAIQWLALRGRLRGAAIWIPATTAGLYLAALANVWLNQSLFELVRDSTAPNTLWTAGLAAGTGHALVYGLITGAAMRWLLRRDPADPAPNAGVIG